jgi:hypothetical protein
MLGNTTSVDSTTSSSFIGLSLIGNGTHWLKANERGLGDFLPLLSMPSDIKIGLIDYIIKVVGGAVTFGLIAIALRRRFESIRIKIYVSNINSSSNIKTEKDKKICSSKCKPVTQTYSLKILYPKSLAPE